MARRRKAYGVAVNPACPVEIDHPLNQGLQHWWNVVPNQGWSGGTILRDAIRGVRTPVDGVLNGSLGWNGNLQGIRTPGSFTATNYITHSLIALNSYTWSAWVKASNPSSGGLAVSSNSTAWIGINNASSLTIRLSDTSGANVPSYTVNANQWYYYIVTRDTSVSAFVCFDGVITSLAASNGSPFTFHNIGATEGGGLPLAGSISSIRLLNRVINTSEALKLHAEAKTGFRNTLRWLSTKVYSFKTVAAGGGFRSRIAGGLVMAL